MMANIERTLNLTTKVCCNSALSISANSEIAIATENGIHIMDFSQNPAKYMDQFSFTATRIPPCQEAYRPDVGISHDQALKCYAVYSNELAMKLVHDRALNHRSPECLGYKLVGWSPPGMDQVSRCIMAALSLDHRLSIYSRERTKQNWTRVVCMSDQLNEYMKSYKDTDVELKDDAVAILYKRRMYRVSVTEFSWSPLLCTKTESVEKSSITQCGCLVTATKSGHIVFWRIETPISMSTVQVEKVIQLPNEAIVSALCWCTDKTSHGCLILGCVNGHIYKITLLDYMVTELWTECDDVRVTHIIWLNKIDMIVASKGTYIILMKLSDSLESQSVVIKCVSNKLPITGLVQYGDDKICLSVGDGTVQVGVIITNGNTEPSIDFRELRIQRHNVKAVANHGLVISPNFMFIAVIESPAEMYCHLRVKDPLKIHVINLSTPSEAIGRLISSSSDNFSGLCDALISVKFHNGQSQSCPEIEEFIDTVKSKQFIEDSSFSHLKLLRYILQIRLKNSVSEDNEVKSLLEQLSNTILKRHLVSMLNYLVDKELCETESYIACLLCSMLRKMGQNSVGVTSSLETLEKQMSSSTDLHLPESCPICKSSITDVVPFFASCLKGHKFSRCSQTLMICHQVPYRLCVFCQTIYSHKLQESDTNWLQTLQTDFCLFCDQSLVYSL